MIHRLRHRGGAGTRQASGRTPRARTWGSDRRRRDLLPCSRILCRLIGTRGRPGGRGPGVALSLPYSVSIGVAAALLPSMGQSALAWWILNSGLAPVRLLPLLGLGVGLGLAGRWSSITVALIFSIGVTGGFLAQDLVVSTMAAVPHAVSNEFPAGPISCLAVGLALAPGARLRKWILPVAAAVAGAMLALAIKVTDPSLHDPTISVVGVLFAVWIVASVSLTLRAFRREWFVVAGRILGSWLIAIGLLYGGVSLVPKRGLPVPPSAGPLEPPGSTLLPGDDRRIRARTGPGISAVLAVHPTIWDKPANDNRNVERIYMWPRRSVCRRHHAERTSDLARCGRQAVSLTWPRHAGSFM